MTRWNLWASLGLVRELVTPPDYGKPCCFPTSDNMRSTRLLGLPLPNPVATPTDSKARPASSWQGYDQGRDNAQTSWITRTFFFRGSKRAHGLVSTVKGGGCTWAAVDRVSPISPLPEQTSCYGVVNARIREQCQMALSKPQRDTAYRGDSDACSTTLCMRDA
jgi:hypothetical protein